MRFLNSVQQIVNSDAINPTAGVCRHLGWQARRAFRRFPCELTISDSRLLAHGATGVPALVNAMGMYDFHNMSLLKVLLTQRHATFVDVGANIGPYTLIASEAKTASVVSIEPHPVTFEMLKRNVDMNKRANVECLNLALSDRDGQIKLTDQPGSSINRVIQSECKAEYVSVPCRTLDGLCADLEIRPDIVKIDVEGHESHVLDGFRKSLSEVLLLFIEGGEKGEIRSVMREGDFTGPLYFHHGDGVLSPLPQRRTEDPIYVSKLWLSEFRVCGIKIVEPAAGDI